MSHYMIKDATLAETGKVVSVEIEDEFIKRIYHEGEAVPACEEWIDAKGLLLFPGVIDDHVHFREPGMTEKADIHSESRAAAAGGVTSYMEMPNTNPQTVTFEDLENKQMLAAEKSVVNYSFFFGATHDNSDLLPLLKDHSEVPGVKLFMGSSTGNMLVEDIDGLLDVFNKTPKNMIIMTHCEDMTIIDENMKGCMLLFGGEDAPTEFHPTIRTAEACYSSTRLAIRMANRTGARLHVAHVSSKKEVELFEKAPLYSGKRITAEVCVPHLLFSMKDYTPLGSRIKCNPAIKSEEDRQALRDGIHQGWVDVIGTDHAPHLLSQKFGGCMKAASGMPMVQFSLIAMCELVKEGVLTYADIVRLMCHNPAELFGVDKRGDIKVGNYADLVLVEETQPWMLTNEIIESKCKWSPLEYRRFQHKVNTTICNGHIVYENGKVDDDYRGMPLKFNR